MAKNEEIVMVDRPVEEVWKFLADISKSGPKIDPTLLEMKQTSEGPIGVGTTFESRHPKVVYYLRISEFEPNRKYTEEFSAGPMKGSTITLGMEDMEGKTRLYCTFGLKLSGFYKLIGPIAARSARREILAGLKNVKRILESEGQP